MLVPCPWCGPREEEEFHYGGEAGVAYPTDPDAADDPAWGRFLYTRANPAGPLRERWLHSAGCRRWFAIERDTRTNRFLSDPRDAALEGDRP